VLKNQISIDLDREQFSPGDVVRGTINFELRESLPIGCVKFKVNGNEKATFEDPSKNSGETERDEYKNELIGFNGKCALIKDKDGLKAGIYSVRFEFLLPDNLPSSINHYNKQFNQEYRIKIRYSIKVSLMERLINTQGFEVYHLHPIMSAKT